MTITENTPGRLIVDHVPWGMLASLLGFMSIWIAGAVVFIVVDLTGGALVFLGLGTILPMALIWGLVARSQLVFDRAAGTVEHRRRGFRGFTRQPFALNAIKRIYVGQNGPNHGKIFLEVSEGMDAGHHEFPKDRVPLQKAIIAGDAITVWLGA